MRGEGNEAMREVLEPSQQQVERVVAAALAPGPPGARREAPWLAVAAAVVLVAVVVTFARRERPFTGPFPVAARTEATSTISNIGSVMLVTGVEGRTLVASAGMNTQSVAQLQSYRIMISKGTMP